MSMLKSFWRVDKRIVVKVTVSSSSLYEDEMKLKSNLQKRSLEWCILMVHLAA